MRSPALLLVLAPLALSGCYTTVVRSGLPPAGPPTVEWDEKWHSGVAAGIAELSGPYKMPEICPNGWAEIRTETSFLNVVVTGLTMGIYDPQTVTIVCAAKPAGTMPPPGAVPPASATPPPPTTAPPPPPPPPPPPQPSADAPPASEPAPPSTSDSPPAN